ncbi:hypothetical protein JMJ35_008604 [Cladonia borealis]|uniref:Tat pathway signal sequence n=1 Tax=Cladonia borealis TaxID=184061 RepID=A0AA39UYV4_9LECA|nr:hypothetical protein JMJ35_008604 [Cladonia borealis]
MSDSEVQEKLLQDSYQEKFSSRERGIRRHLSLVFVVNLALFAFSIAIIFGSFITSNKNDRLNWQIKEVDFYSPILDKVDLHPTLKEMEGSLFDDSHSVYRGDPGPDVDAAWERVSAKGAEVVMMHRSDISKVGKDPASVVQAPESWGFGPDAIPVQVDVFHQIHCLNELRKEMHYQYYYGDSPRTALHDAHKKHCLHILLQNLMCQGNVDVITHDWVETTARPYADFNILHQCRDFEALLDWQQQNKLENVRERFNSMAVPEGVVRLPFSTTTEMTNSTSV